jgi:protein translocase SecG subunit
MGSLIVYLQAFLAVILTLFVLLQQRAAGITASGGAMNTAIVQRRGAEKLLYQGTIVLGILFAALTILDWYV